MRDDVLAAVRRALGDHRPEPAPRHAHTPTTGDLTVFIDRLEDYRAAVATCTESTLDQAVTDALLAASARSAVLPDGLPDAIAAAAATAGIELVRDDSLSHAALDAIDAVVTTCVGAASDTGTIALDHGPGQGRRALTLLPDHHVCLVRPNQVHASVPDLLAACSDSIRAGRPITWISGPSATSDIELVRVEGVHGPRHLVVLIVQPDSDG